MVQFNFSERTIKAKVVYYGPAQSGKTTNLEQIHQITDPEGTNRLISLNTAQDRTLFFDLLPFSLGAVSGYDFKVQIYTVPGQVQYNATRRVVLAGADAVVFVADSQRGAFKENTPGLREHEGQPAGQPPGAGEGAARPPVNKQDLADLATGRELQKALNFWGRKSFKAVAARGEGVLETFVAVVAGDARRHRGQVQPEGEGPRSGERAPGGRAGLRDAREARPRALAPPGPAGERPAAASPRVVLAQPPTRTRACRCLPREATRAWCPRSCCTARSGRTWIWPRPWGTLVREMNQGIASILSHAELATSYGDEGQARHRARQRRSRRRPACARS